MEWTLGGKGSRRDQLVRALRRAIVSGELPAEARLPPTRALASELACARNVVLDAYAELRADGLVVGDRGGGTRVARGIAYRSRRIGRNTTPAPLAMPRSVAPSVERSRLAWAPGPRVPFDFSLGPPLPDEALLRSIRRTFREVMDVATPRDLDYTDVAGLPALRTAIATRLALYRGLACSADELLVTTGASQAFDLVLRAFVRPGDHVAVEDPGYRPVRAAALAAGAKVLATAVDERGLVVDALARGPIPRVVFVTPGHQFPTGVTLTMDRRLALLEFASRSGAIIVEDDYDGELRDRGRFLPALAGLTADARVLYVGSVSKALGPFVRIGYVRAAPPVIAALALEKALADGGSPALTQQLAARMLVHPSFHRWTRRASELSLRRRQRLQEAVRATRGALAVRSTAPHHLVVDVPGKTAHDERLLVREAQAVGIRVLGLQSFTRRAQSSATLLLGCNRLSEAAIAEGVRRLARILRARA